MTKAPLKLLATGAVVALAVAACSSSSSGGGGGASTTPSTSTTASTANTASDTGITATNVLIGSHQPLTGAAAPGYSEIAPASKAFFDYINANGGINGRTITYKYLNDAYDLAPPLSTTSVVHQLVEQDHVFGIFNGLGTPTHESVVPFLNAQKVPDLFVASGCTCWNAPTTAPETFGWQPDYTVEGKILGQYIAQNYKGLKIGIFAQNDDFGTDGIKGLEDEIPASSVVSTQRYDPTAPPAAVTPLVAKLQSAGAEVVVSFSVPAFTALLQLDSLGLKFAPKHLVVSNVGSDPITLSGLLTSFSKGAAPGKTLVQGIVTDTYLPSAADPSNSWIQLFKKIHKQYIPKLPFDGNVEYGMAAAYTFAEALAAAGQNPTRASIVAAVENSHFTGPGLVPFGYSSTSHSGYTGVQMATIKGLNVVPMGTPFTTDDGSGPITAYTTPPATAPPNGIPPS
jgi:ABC-type branched-subunit amino acid transport system substrate-binding protein